MLKKNSNNVIFGRKQNFSEFNKDNNNPFLENDINNINEDKNEQSEEEDVFVQKTIDNNNLISNISSLATTDIILVSPVKSYGNAELLKDEILKDNKDQSGIYR